MSVFSSYMEMLWLALNVTNHDTESVYQIIKLAGEDQARIFKYSRKDWDGSNLPEPPTTGKFVAACLQPGTNKLILAFKEFSVVGEESKSFAALAYFQPEIYKAVGQIDRWFKHSQIPLADNEYEKLEVVK